MPVNTKTLYEFPLNERMRLLIRLEQLFHRFDYFMHGDSVFAKEIAISLLLDILLIFNRNDLKSELLKELGRHAKILNKIPNSPENHQIDSQKLTATLAEIKTVSAKLYETNGKIGAEVIKNDLFHCISQRNSVLSSSCSFDFPTLHHWLQHDSDIQLQDLQDWSSHFSDIKASVQIILNSIRLSSIATEKVAQAGFFQLSLDKDREYQLVLVAVDKSLPYCVEISGGKHRITIHFVQPSENQNREGLSVQNINFSLSLCAL